MLLQAVADGRRRPTILVNKRLFNGSRQGTLFNHYKMGLPARRTRLAELLSYRMIVDISIMSMCMAVLLN